MKNRTLPYGYCYENGGITVQPQERKILKQIYAAYLDGQSLLTIAEKLNQDGTEYMPKVTAWNKGRLKRLIEDKRYLGTDSFPSLIAKETFKAAQKTKQDRNTQKNTDRSREIFKLTVPVVCPDCGSRMHRRHDSRCKCQERWTCENKDCRLLIEIADAELLETLTTLLGTATPDSMEHHAAAYEPSEMNEKSRLQRQLDGIYEAEQRRENAKSRLDDIFTILDGIKNRPMAYDDQIVRQLLECVVVDSKEQITVIFKGGMKAVQPLTD